jgi:hypothetical protein
LAGERIGDILVEMKACTPQELEAALKSQAIFGGRLGSNLLELGIIDETQLAAALTRAYGVPCLAGDIQPELDAIASVPASLVERLGFVPLHTDDRHLEVVMADPKNLAKLDDLAFATGKSVLAMLAPEKRVWALMYRFYGIEKNLRGLEMADDLEGAATSRGGEVGMAAVPGDAGDAGPRVLPLHEALALIEQVDDPVVLSAVLARGAGGQVGRAVFLKCQGPRAVAWLAAGKLLDRDVRGVDFALERDGPFGGAAELRAPVLAPLKIGRGNAPFFAALGGPPPLNIFVAPVLLRGRAVALLYADAGPAGTLRDEAAGLIALVGALNRRFETLAPVAAPAS